MKLLPWIWIVGLLFSASAFSGEVRTLIYDLNSTQSIKLLMGRSTVMSFPEKPQKVIIGNSRYYNLEYIDNDVTIQPLAPIRTNLFIYTKKGVYSFILTFGRESHYDDLVRIAHAQPKRQETQETLNYQVYGIPDSQIYFKIHHAQSHPGFGVVSIDIEIMSLATQEKDIKEFHVLDQENTENKILLVSRDSKLKFAQPSKIRIILPEPDEDSISLVFSIKNLSKTVSLTKSSFT